RALQTCPGLAHADDQGGARRLIGRDVGRGRASWTQPAVEAGDQGDARTLLQLADGDSVYGDPRNTDNGDSRRRSERAALHGSIASGAGAVPAIRRSSNGRWRAVFARDFEGAGSV